MTPAQTSLYWRTWAAVCHEHGWPTSDTTRRRALHAQAKCPPSMRAFTNVHFDRFLSVARQILGSRECTPVAAEAGERKRLLWRIQQDMRTSGLSDPYLDKIATDQYGLSCWRDLCIADLTNLRNTLHNRAGKKIHHDTRTVQTTPTLKRGYILRPHAAEKRSRDLLPF